MEIQNVRLKEVVQRLTLALDKGHDDLISENNDLGDENNKLEEQIKSLELESKKYCEEAEISRRDNSTLTWEKVGRAAKNVELEEDVSRLQLDVKKATGDAERGLQSFEPYKKRVQILGSELLDEIAKEPAK
jgi:hypothetical protein